MAGERGGSAKLWAGLVWGGGSNPTSDTLRQSAFFVFWAGGGCRVVSKCQHGWRHFGCDDSFCRYGPRRIGELEYYLLLGLRVTH